MTWLYGILIDLILIAVICLFARAGAKNGFAKTVVSFLGLVIAIVLASALCKPSAEFIYEKNIKNRAESAVERIISDKVTQSAETAPKVSEVFDSLSAATEKFPAALKKMLALEERRDAISAQINEMYTSNVRDISVKVTDAILKPVILTALSGVCFILLFAIIFIICRIAARLLKFVNKIPGLGKVNALMGGILGAAKGVLAVAIICWLLIALEGNGAKVFGFITPDTLYSSLIVKTASNLDPLGFVLSGQK